jgi:hypothetical protein
MDSCSLPDFLPGSSTSDGKRRYTLQEMLCMRSSCLDKPNGMQEHAKDGNLLQCSLLAESSKPVRSRGEPFDWEHLAGSLQVRGARTPTILHCNAGCLSLGASDKQTALSER